MTLPDMTKSISTKDLMKGLFNLLVALIMGMATFYLRDLGDLKSDVKNIATSIADLNTKMAIIMNDTERTKSDVDKNSKSSHRNREDILILKEQINR